MCFARLAQQHFRDNNALGSIGRRLSFTGAGHSMSLHLQTSWFDNPGHWGVLLSIKGKQCQRALPGSGSGRAGLRHRWIRVCYSTELSPDESRSTKGQRAHPDLYPTKYLHSHAGGVTWKPPAMELRTCHPSALNWHLHSVTTAFEPGSPR